MGFKKILLSIWLIKDFIPEGLFIEFGDIVPGFARTNTLKKDWKERVLKLSNGDEYIQPPYKDMKGHFVLLHDWPVKYKKNDEEICLTIPRGQATDFASIPKALHSLISPLSNTIYSAVLHDYLYRSPEDSIALNTSRKVVDDIFYYGMKAKGVSRFLAFIMYLGVRLGGKGSYKGRS